jgi:hypothetical protein
VTSPVNLACMDGYAVPPCFLICSTNTSASTSSDIHNATVPTMWSCSHSLHTTSARGPWVPLVIWLATSCPLAAVLVVVLTD